MTTTPTLWGTEDPLFPFTTDALPKVAALKDGTVDMVCQRAGGDLVDRHLNELGGLPCGDFLSALSSSTDMTRDRPGGTVMIRPTPRNIGLAAAAAMVLAGGVAFANPEAGGKFSQASSFVFIPSVSAAAPTILRTVSIKCPVAGFLLANAEASFQLSFSTATPNSPAVMHYGISRTTAFDTQHDHAIELPTNPVNPIIPGSMQRFDNCTAGQTITYRFIAFLVGGLTAATNASQPTLSAIFLRDHD